MSLIKILGIGSPFGEDQVGWKVTELLSDNILSQSSVHHDFSQYVTIECCDRPGIRLLELMQNAEIVFLMDAVKTGAELGTIHRLQNDEIYELKNVFSTHDVGVVQALQIGNALNQLPENIILYGIEINNIEWCATISGPVAAAINRVADQLIDEVVDLVARMVKASRDLMS